MSVNNDMSLVSLLRDNPDYIDRIQDIAEEVKKDKTKILSMAEKYGKKYDNEIAEGTKRKQILITEGIERGQSKEEVEQSMGFIPSIYTPILNWLYFFMREENIPKREMLREEQESEYKHLLHEEINVDGMNKVPEVFVILSGKNISYDKFKTLKKLKTMSKSQNNEHEAFNAYTQCLKLCNKYDIEFDSIPT